MKQHSRNSENAGMGRLARSARVKNAAAWALSLALLFAAASQTQAETKRFDGGGQPYRLRLVYGYQLGS